MIELGILLVASLCPQQQPGRLVLPPVERQQEKPARELELSEVERFQRDVFALRRSARLSEPSQDLVLKKLSGDYQQPSVLAMLLARTAESDLLWGLLQVVRRFGVESDAKELQFLLQTRPFGAATRLGVEVMAELSRGNAKAALMSCLTSRYAGVRKAATDLLLARIDATDLDALVALSREPDTDIRRKALFLLGALPHEPARLRLLEALSDPDLTISSTACRSLIDHGPDVAPALKEIVSHAAADRSFGYAAFALTMLEDQTGLALLAEEMTEPLRSELTGPDLFMRATTALALANLAFRSDDVGGLRFSDREVVDGLLLVVAPKDFVPNISMLQRPATRKLQQFTGMDFQGRSAAWRAWWETARPGFVGTRLALPITPENGALATLTWSDEHTIAHFRGENAPAPAEQEEEADIVDEYLLSGPEMDALVKRLEAQGFMTHGLLASAASTEMLPVARTLDLRLGTARCQVSGPTAPAQWLDVLAAEIAAVEERERWQLYPDPQAASHRKAFWESERAWLAAHKDRTERQRRLVASILAAYPSLPPARATRAIDHLEAIPDLAKVLTADDGLRVATLAQETGAITNDSYRLLELSLEAPGDDAWRVVLDVVDTLFDAGGKDVLPRVFSVLGPDKVLAAIADGRPRIREAAILEAAKLKDLRAVPQLLALLEEDDRAVREAAIYALGLLRCTDAREPLLKLQADPAAAPTTRRVAWVALGRIGGDEVLPLLESAVAAADLADQLAAIQALGELADPGAAHFLAQIFAAHGLNPLGTQAMASLQKMGGLLARPALRRHLTTRDERVRREIVLLLAEVADPMVIPDLIAMLEADPKQTRIAVLLSGITGLDLVPANDRSGIARQWWRSNRERSQALWFLDALQRGGVATSLTAEQLHAGAGLDAVDELSRLMVESEAPHLRVLAAALLRDVTERDFGLVSAQTPSSQLQALADRYRFYADAERAARHR
jgi:HEAT repeat protein